MPRFYFDLYEDDVLLVDHEGGVLRDALLARREAGRILAAIARDNYRPEGPWPTLRIVLRSHDREGLWETVLRWEERQLSRLN
ncbi:DUF6894 family protein [Devosia sp. A16]|uniref:DUF6894 family protein n=1 Tax=Devosia sp. A16 TaxID=1736675 RepID=UPI0006D7B488|nr:hypothetical protein [Devosia sp. A16]